MKIKIFLFIALILPFFISCKKNSTSSSSQTEVEYQVTTNVSSLNAFYNNENEQFVGGTYSSGWKYNFKTSKKPFTTSLRSTAVGSTTVTITVKILINGSVAATNTASGTNSADVQTQYIIQ